MTDGQPVRDPASDVPVQDGHDDPAYEPPRLTRLGNLRDLLGKSGGTIDHPGPNPRRP